MPTFQILEAEMVMWDRERPIADLSDVLDPFPAVDLEAPAPEVLGSTGSGRALMRWLHRVMIVTN